MQFYILFRTAGFVHIREYFLTVVVFVSPLLIKRPGQYVRRHHIFADILVFAFTFIYVSNVKFNYSSSLFLRENISHKNI